VKRVTDKKYWMHPTLYNNLVSLAHNVMDNGWDSVILISGDGMTRVGKSMLAQQIGYFLASLLETKFDITNIMFGTENLRDTVMKRPKNSVYVFDEARESFDSKKTMSKKNIELATFFDECGMMNNVYILVLPNFYDLMKGLAVNRSEFLINCKRVGESRKVNEKFNIVSWKRGYYDFYNRRRKHKLYITHKKFEFYDPKFRNFWGEFRKYWVIDEDLYNEKKVAFLKRADSKGDEDNIWKKRCGIFAKVACKDKTQYEVARMVTSLGYRCSQPRLNQLIRGADIKVDLVD
jgi:hypothetical protein